MINTLIPEKVHLQGNFNNPKDLLQNSKYENFGLDELANIPVINSNIKAKMKKALDKLLMRKNFEPNQRVYLYDSRPHLHPDKLRS
ncbi:hypothetical protein TIFTF001_017142 [Ficus carica]|uniref:Uncharacterized protein n=1 Tax=Ficus carica TaxID=3494 RepID=A0AA88AA20_FICCA|nr:hypothetical protein TIFTF001_017142 [Ficus carica]